MKRTQLICGVDTIQRKIARKIREEGVRKVAGETGIPVATAGKHSRDFKRLSLEEIAKVAEHYGCELALVIRKPNKWNPLQIAGLL